MSDDLQRLPVGFPRDVHEALRRKAFDEHRSMSEIVVEAVREKLGMAGDS